MASSLKDLVPKSLHGLGAAFAVALMVNLALAAAGIAVAAAAFTALIKVIAHGVVPS